jgi:hypothetical protein
MMRIEFEVNRIADFHLSNATTQEATPTQNKQMSKQRFNKQAQLMFSPLARESNSQLVSKPRTWCTSAQL